MIIRPLSIAHSAQEVVSRVSRGASDAPLRSGRTQTFNLLKYFKKGLHEYDEIEGIIFRLSEEEKCIGTLPDKWRKLFKPSEILSKTFEMHNIFSDFAKKFQSSRDSKAIEEYLIELFAEKIKKFTGRKTKITYTGEGMFGTVLRIQCGKEDLALKVFHEIPEVTEPFFVSAHKVHGQTMEIQNAIALNHALSPSKRSRFYMGKATTIGDDGAYMLTEFVKTKKGRQKTAIPYSPREDFTYTKFILGDSLSSGNIINGKIVDFGNITYRFENQAQRDIAKKLFPLICKGDIKSLRALKKVYSGNSDFETVLENSSATIVKLLEYPGDLRQFMLYDGAKEVLSSLIALGIDFPALKTYKHFKPSQVRFLKSVGIDVKNCQSPSQQY